MCVCDLCVSHGRKNLGDGVSFQLDGFVGGVRQAERSYVPEPLDLVDDSIGVWKVHAVIHSRSSGLSDHPVDLGLNLFCASRGRGISDQACGVHHLFCTF